MEQTEDAFFSALAERPYDRALRLVFCDWLLERGDARGEAMALFEKGSLSGAERRRLAKLQQLNGRKWLGPLAGIVALDECRFAGGLLHSVTFPANLPAGRYAALAGEPRLATVESVSIEPGRVAAEVGSFLAHPVLARVVTLEGDVATLLKARGYSFSPQVLRIALWHPRDELSQLAACTALHPATVLRLSAVEFINPDFAEELADAVVGSKVLEGRKRLELVARYATIEGVARWLRVARARVRGPARGMIQRWAVSYAETHLGLEGEHFEQFTIDAMAAGGKEEVGIRIATAASVLALLDGIGITKVDVRHVPGGRLTKDELNTLRAALRRLKTLEEFQVGGVPQSP